MDLRLHRLAARNRADAGEIILPFLEAEFDILERLFARLGDMHRPDKAQPLRIHLAAVFGGHIVGDFPVHGERVIAIGLRRGHAQHAEAMLARELAARWRDARRHADFRMRPGIGPQLAGRIDQIEPVAFLRHALAREQLQDHLDPFHHAVALRRRIDAHLERIGRQAVPARRRTSRGPRV